MFFIKKFFQSLGSEYFLRTDLEVSRHFLFYRFETNQRGAKTIPKTFLKTRLKSKERIVFGKYLVVSFQSQSIRVFSVFLEDILKKPDVAGKNLKPDSDSAQQKQSRIVDFSSDRNLFIICWVV
jgi:hypothetical protein